MSDLRILQMTAYPDGPGPYGRWEVTVKATGAVIIAGDMPVDQNLVRAATEAYHQGLIAAGVIDAR
jgi:hypothetical protein